MVSHWILSYALPFNLSKKNDHFLHKVSKKERFEFFSLNFSGTLSSEKVMFQFKFVWGMAISFT